MPRIRAATIDEHKEKTRREILEAASHLFRVDGFADTTLRDVADHVGIGRTTLYEYFSDKEDLLASLVEETIPGVVDQVLGSLPESLSCRERLSELIVRGLELVSSDAELGGAIMRDLPKLGGPAQRRVRRAHAKLEVEVTNICKKGIASGEFRPFDPTDTGRLVYTMMMSTSQSLLRDTDAKQRLHEVADMLVRLMFDGLAME